MSVSENLSTIHATIKKVAKAYDVNDAAITLIAVSKTQPQEKIEEALRAGQRVFGENRVQEAKDRWQPIRERVDDVQLHLIGPLQTNKVRDAVALFDMIHSVDRENLVEALAKEMDKQAKSIPCLIQINTGEEPQKAGIAPHELKSFLDICRRAGLDIRGLMCIPPVDDPPALHFALLRKLAQENNLPELSMGMSDDYEKAIPLGATYLRVGSAIFGARVTPAA